MRKVLILTVLSLLLALFLSPIDNVVYGQVGPEGGGGGGGPYWTTYSVKAYADPSCDPQMLDCTADADGNSPWWTSVGSFEEGIGSMAGNYWYQVTDWDELETLFWVFKTVHSNPTTASGNEQTYEDHEYKLEIDCCGSTGYYKWFTWSKGCLRVLKDNPS